MTCYPMSTSFNGQQDFLISRSTTQLVDQIVRLMLMNLLRWGVELEPSLWVEHTSESDSHILRFSYLFSFFSVICYFIVLLHNIFA